MCWETRIKKGISLIPFFCYQAEREGGSERERLIYPDHNHTDFQRITETI